jgi:predicted PurR-regulated permease PerM
MDRTHPSARVSRTPTVLVVITCIAALYFASEVLVPVALAVLLAFALAPLVRRLERWRVHRVLAVVLVMSGFVAGVVALGWVLHGQAVQLATDLPGYKTNISAKLSVLRGSSTKALDRASTALKEIGNEIVKPDGETKATATVLPPEPAPVRIVDTTTSPIDAARSLLGPVVSRLATAAIVVVFAVFILIQREELRNRLVRLMGKESMHQTTPALDDAAARVSRYLLLQLVVNAIAGTAIGAGLMVLGVPGALLWGCLTVVLRFIPFIGTFAAAAFPILISLAVSSGWQQPVLVAALITAVEVTCSQIVEPLLIGAGTGLSSIAVLASALFWGWLWGPVGLLVSTPIAVCLAVMGKHFKRLAFLDVLLSDKVALTPPARLYQRLLAGDPEESSRIVAEFRKDKPAIVAVYDGLLMPALRLAETARHGGDLDEDQERSAREIVATLVDDVGPPDCAGRSGAVLCVAARDAMDGAAARMLAQVLCAGGTPAEVVSEDTLTGELLVMVDSRRPPLVCVSAVPPSAAMHARVVCKRLKARFPELPVVIGLWDGQERSDAAFAAVGDAGTQYIVTTLAQAATTIAALKGGAAPEASAA